MRIIPHVEPRYRALYLPMLGSFVLFGLSLAVTGAVVPRIIRDFGWSYTATGLVLCAGSAGYIVSTFLCGVLIRRLGPKWVIVGGLAVQALGQALFAATPGVAPNVLTMLLIGVGAGGTEVVVNYGVVRIERSGQSRLMNLTHAAFAVGAILSPLAVEALVAMGASWQTMFRLMALASLAMSAAMALLPFARLHDVDEARGEEPGVGALLRQPLLILCFLILLVYVGVEIGVSSWVAEYYVTVLKTPAGVGSMMVSVFWLGLLAGRVGVSVVYHGTRLAEVLVLLAATSTAALLVALGGLSPWRAGAGFLLTGVGYSAVYPLVMSLVGRHFARGQSVAIGFAGAGGAVGALVVPFAVAAVADHVGMRRAFFLYAGLNVVMMGLIVGVAFLIRRAATAPAAQHSPTTGRP
jgi:fucose permease